MIIKSPSVYLHSNMSSKEQVIPINRTVELTSKVSVAGQLDLKSHMAIPVFRFPNLLYGSALSTGSSASEQKATDQLEDAQTVTADPKQLIQVWE